MWRPQPTAAGAELNNGRNGDPESRHPGSRQQHGEASSGGESGGQNPNKQPRWVEELESQFFPGRHPEL